ncbi:hypothetical protein ACSBOB_18700 [Mesorhizobium sp. ASY16-5R]|uniref:hypothetical protein n=1 Tax=Mesorhizobium sp. ASY16-5R TaxID=3445772 RepID=UPI003FA0527F
MGELANRDFASLLDDLIAASGQAGSPVAAPTIPFDYLSVAEELHSGRIRVSDDAVEAQYREAAGDGLAYEPAVVLEPDVPLATEPEAIAIELGLEKARAEDFHRIRRRFAFANHPDRVAPHLRERAMLRMQVANMLIDEASRRATGAR